MEQKRNRSLINGYWNAAGLQFIPAPDCNPQTRNHKQASIFVELADAYRLSETARASGQPASTAAARTEVSLTYMYGNLSAVAIQSAVGRGGV